MTERPPQVGPLTEPSIVANLEQPTYSPAEIAKRWGCSAETVRHAIHCGELAGFRAGPRLLRVRADALAEYELRRASSPGVLGPREPKPPTWYLRPWRHKHPLPQGLWVRKPVK